MLPLWILLGLLGALLLLAILYWCCWRPGYCPWRLARVRNIGCCQGSKQITFYLELITLYRISPETVDLVIRN